MCRVVMVDQQRKYTPLDRDIFRLMDTYGAVKYSPTPVKLNAGEETHFYVSTRSEVTEHPDLLYLLGRLIARVPDQYPNGLHKSLCFIGIPVAGTTLAQAASMFQRLSEASMKRRIIFRVMRSIQKGHGRHQKWTDGDVDHKEHEYWLVENALTSGKSVKDASDKLIRDGYDLGLVTLLILVDRQQSNGLAEVQKLGFKRVAVIYTLRDIIQAFVLFSGWPQIMLDTLELELDTERLKARA